MASSYPQPNLQQAPRQPHSHPQAHLDSQPQSHAQSQPITDVKPPGSRLMLPPRAVTADTIEDAFVSFILYCNPAVPGDADVTALREAFRTPPRSDGKSFSSFHLYRLIQKLETNEIKTWVELALRLGVDPPDQSKGQSTQKIQQYAVRLKRWMHSMHVDAFFEYLIGRGHVYWTHVPADSNPIHVAGRDGVAPEDDMALRALLPHIRPRRGRKRADDEDHHPAAPSPSRRPRPESPPAAMPHSHSLLSVPDNAEPWPTHHGHHTDRFATDVFRNQSRPFPSLRQPEAAAPPADWPVPQQQHLDAPLSAHPHSAITPSSRQMFWADEPRSAVTPGAAAPQKPKKRYGAKAVSSAWRSTSRGKTRGRPPAGRTPVDGNFAGGFGAKGIQVVESAFPSVHDESPPGHGDDQDTSSMYQPSHATHMHDQNAYQNMYHDAQQRPQRPSISLQVPQRDTSDVRLVAPPAMGLSNHAAAPLHYAVPTGPAATVSSQQQQASPSPCLTYPDAAGANATVDTHHVDADVDADADADADEYNTPAASDSIKPNFPTKSFPPKRTSDGDLDFPSLRQAESTAPVSPPAPGTLPPPHDRFPNPFRSRQEDTTNLEKLYNFLLIRALGAEWIGPDGQPDYPADVAESRRIVDATFIDLHRKAKTKEAFLVNVAVLAGGKILVAKAPRFQRAEVTPAFTRYILAWEYRLGSLTAAFTSRATVYKDKAAAAEAADEAASRHFERADVPPQDPTELSKYWKQKYTELLRVTADKEDMEDQVVAALVSGSRRVGSWKVRDEAAP